MNNYNATLLDKNLITVDNLTWQQINKLSRLNKYLSQIEVKINDEFIRISRSVSKRCVDKNDWIEDYEIEYNISFSLNENDPLYDDSSNNLLITLKRPEFV